MGDPEDPKILKDPEKTQKRPRRRKKKKEEKERSSFTITQQREKNMSKNMRNGTQNTAKVSHQTTRLRATHTGVSKASSLRATHTGGSNRQESSFAATHQDGSNRQESSLRATHTGGSNRQCNDGSNRHSLRATHTGGSNRQESSLRATHTGGSNRQCNDGSNRHTRRSGWSNLRVLPRLLILVALTQVSWAVNVNRILERLPVHVPVKQIIKSSSGSSKQLRASAQNVAEKVRSTEAGAEHVTIGAEHVTSGKGEKPVKLAPIEFTGVSMLKAKKSLSQNYEIRNIEYNPDNHVYGFKKIKNFNFKIMGIKNLKMCSKSGYLQVLLRLKRTNKKGETGYKTNTWMKGACNRWVLLDTSGIQFLRSAYFNDLEEGVHTSEKKSQFLCDFVTGNPILAGILGVIIDDPKTHFAALKLKKQGKTSRSYEVRNINVLGTRNGRNQVYMFVNSSQYKRTNGNFHIGSPFIFNIVSIEAVTDDIKTGLCRVLLTFNRIGGGSGWGGCPRYLLLDREGIKFMTWLLIKQALEGHYILNEPSLVTKQREKIQISTNKGRMAADHKSTKPLEDLVFDPRLQAVLLLVLDARKKLNADQAEKNRDIEQKQAAYKIIVEEQTAKLKKWESTVADACAMKNLDESIKKLLAPDNRNDISGLGWFQDLDAAASFKKGNRLPLVPGKTSTTQQRLSSGSVGSRSSPSNSVIFAREGPNAWRLPRGLRIGHCNVMQQSAMSGESAMSGVQEARTDDGLGQFTPEGTFQVRLPLVPGEASVTVGGGDNLSRSPAGTKESFMRKSGGTSTGNLLSRPMSGDGPNARGKAPLKGRKAAKEKAKPVAATKPSVRAGVLSTAVEKTIEERWYYMDKTEVQKGPITRDQIMELKLKNEIDDATFVWHKTATTGLGDRKDGWTKYGSVKFLTAGVGALRRRLASRRRLENRPIHRLLREIRRAQA